jgi:methylglutaconyl-CoA hydratase
MMDVSQEGVAAIILNRPSVGNALAADMVGELADAFGALSRTPEVRLVLLRGAGDAFSAGLDRDWLAASLDYSREEHEEDAFALAEMLRAVRRLPQTTIALLHGPAADAGAGLALACDIVVAGPAASFSFTDARRGASPAIVAPYLLEAVGAHRARALLTSGETVSAGEAFRIGLIHHLAANETEMEAILERLADSVFRAAPAAIAEIKDLLDEVARDAPSADLSRTTARRSAQVLLSPEAREGLSAHLASRSPAWAL